MEVRCKKLAPSSFCFITDIPTPILMEILCRLPIKTLIACKCVCKSWLNLSIDPEFTQLHQSRAPTGVCFQIWNDKDMIMLNFHCLNNIDPRDVKLNTSFEIPKFSLRLNDTLNYGAGMKYLELSNSCNGLLCFYGGYHNGFVLVWNPCTSEFITVPTLAATYCCHYGLGFSGKANKYKLLRVVREKSHENVVAEILTIEKGCSWNTLGARPSNVWEVIDFCFPYKHPAFLHDTLHWPGFNDDILTFDFEDEQFGRVPLPLYVGKTSTSVACRVGELLGCLVITECTGKSINIWLMKEYGVEDSWTKMYSLPCIVKGERINENFFLPVTCMDNGEILLACSTDSPTYSSTVFSYNPDLEGFRCIASGPDFLRVIAYRPSLVLLKDSMLGYEVNVSASKHKEMSKSPDWWTLLTKHEKRKRPIRATSESSVLPNMSDMMEDTMERIKTMREEVVEKQRKEHRANLQEFEERVRNELVKVFEPFKEQIEQLNKHNQRLEGRLQDEKAKVKQQTQQNQQLEERLRDEKELVKQHIQQSEQLKQQNQQLEEILKNEHTKVKQLEEKLRQSDQLKEES